jgi:hypothetical protein
MIPAEMGDAERHCVALIIKRITNCDDEKAIESAAMIHRYYAGTKMAEDQFARREVTMLDGE